MFTIFENALSTLNSIVWGPGMLILLVGTGLYLTLRLRFLSLRSIPKGFRLLWQGRSKLDSVEGEPFPLQCADDGACGNRGHGQYCGRGHRNSCGRPRSGVLDVVYRSGGHGDQICGNRAGCALS